MMEQVTNSFSSNDREKASEVLQKATPIQFKINNRPIKPNAIFETVRETMITQNNTGECTSSYLNLLTVDVMPASRIPIIGRIICLSKRLARRWLIWYLRPVFERQSVINQRLFDQIKECEYVINMMKNSEDEVE